MVVNRESQNLGLGHWTEQGQGEEWERLRGKGRLIETLIMTPLVTLCHWLHGMEVTKYAANIDFVNV